MAIQYGNDAGPGPSLFQTRIEYSYADRGNGYYRLTYRYYVSVTQGDFYGTNLSTSWGGNVYISGVGDYAHSGWSYVDVKYGAATNLSATCSYTGGSTYTSTASYRFTAPNPQYTITYNANGGTGAPGKQTYTYASGAHINLSSAIPKRTGYKFLGWSLDKDAKAPTYSAGQKWARTNRGNYVLYAVWKRNGQLNINQNGVYKKGRAYIKSEGIWKNGIPWKKVNGTWKRGGV